MQEEVTWKKEKEKSKGVDFVIRYWNYGKSEKMMSVGVGREGQEGGNSTAKMEGSSWHLAKCLKDRAVGGGCCAWRNSHI